MTTSNYQPGSSGIDTCISSGDETSNGSETYFLISNQQRILIKFDISDISSSAICSSATLSLYSYSSSAMTGDTYTAYSVLAANNSWDESATWNTRDGSNNWAGSAGCSTSGTDYNGTSIGSCVMNETFLSENQFPLTPSTVTTWFGGSNLNYGIIIFNPAIRSGGLYASDETINTAYRPKLSVTYSLSGLKYRKTFSSLGTKIGSRGA